MSLKQKLIKTISEIQDIEDKNTKVIFELTKKLSDEGFLSKEVGLRILKWKSPRPLKHYEKNSEEDFKLITKNAFSQENEKLRIHTLTALTGVNYPSASAILMFYDSSKYPVIDIRVWRQLYKHDYVKENEKGQNLTLNQWIKYLEIIRKIAADIKLSPRQVEKRIFELDKMTQIGKLYDKN